MFASGSRARIMQIRLQLSTIKKNDLSIADYFNKVKNLADTLSAIGHHLQEEEIISYMPAGLDSEYDALVMSVSTRTDVISLTDLYAHMLSYEMCKEHQNSISHITGFSANNVTRNGREGRYAPRGRGQGRGKQTSANTSNQVTNQPVCQVCGKIGHIVLQCFHRFDHSYQAVDNHVVVLARTSSYVVDPNWYTDTDATDHITSDLDRLSIQEKYNGKDQVQVANGPGLSIHHIGHS